MSTSCLYPSQCHKSGKFIIIIPILFSEKIENELYLNFNASKVIIEIRKYGEEKFYMIKEQQNITNIIVMSYILWYKYFLS